MPTQALCPTASPALFDLGPKSAQDPAQGLPYAPISVAAWQAILSPEQMSKYAYTAYDSLLSLTALETMQNHDWETEGHFGRDVATIENLRTALASLYAESSCELFLTGGRLRVQLTVPGGSLTYWPAQIPKPETAEAAEMAY